MKWNQFLEGKTIQPRWVKPNLQEETNEIIRTSKILGINQSYLLKACNSGRMSQLSDSIWSTMENTDSWQIRPGDINTVNAFAQQYGRDVQNIIQGIKSGQPIPVPIVLIHNNQPYLIAGNTRLMVSRALNIRPQVLLVVV